MEPLEEGLVPLGLRDQAVPEEVVQEGLVERPLLLLPQETLQDVTLPLQGVQLGELVLNALKDYMPLVGPEVDARVYELLLDLPHLDRLLAGGAHEAHGGALLVERLAELDDARRVRGGRDGVQGPGALRERGGPSPAPPGLPSGPVHQRAIEFEPTSVASRFQSSR